MAGYLPLAMIQLSALDWKAQKIAKEIGRLQSIWPDAIVLGGAVASLYDVFPYLFTAAFPPLPEAQLQTFAIASRLYATSIFLHDKLYDKDPNPETIERLVPVNAVRVLAMQWEAYHLLHELFPASSVFWKDFRGFLVEFAGACAEEQRFVAGGRSWCDLSEELALDIARAKNGVARTTLAGLAAMSGTRSSLPPLIKALDGYNAASQMLDDLRDWKEDLQSGTPSLVLVRAAGEKPAWASDEELENITSEIGRRLFYGGHANYILNLAITELDKAEGAIETWPNLAWLAMHKDLRDECALLQEDLERIALENVHRLVKQEPISLELPSPKDEWQALAWQALRYIVEQWHLGYGEARHIMEFPPKLGLSGPQYQRGDIFQRALITDTLCDANRELNDALRLALDDEVGYLLSRRRPDGGGWAYFPDLPELPPDADDLAQVMQVLWSSGHRPEIAEYCNKPLSTILEGAHADGSFETWIIPLSNRTVIETRQMDFAHTMWGTGADPEVMANLLHALALIDRKRYSEEIERGVRYLMKQQSHDGSWESTWYHGPHYGTYACLRLLSQVEFAHDSVQKAAAFLRQSQNPDAGWGLGASSNALDTSLALLGLATLQSDALDSRQDLMNASNALDYLRRQANSNGSLPSCKFIQMDVGRATQGPSQVLSYGSRTITTSFALKAALAWHNISIGGRVNPQE